MKKADIREELNTNLYKNIMGDKLSLITMLKDQRDAILDMIAAEYDELTELKKQKKEIKKNIKIKKRAIRQNESERFKLTKKIKEQSVILNQLTDKYIDEEDISIDSSKYYPEAKKTR